MTAANDWNQKIIDEFRRNGGKVGGQFEGAPLLLLHTKGAKSGEERINPVMYRDLGGHELPGYFQTSKTINRCITNIISI